MFLNPVLPSPWSAGSSVRYFVPKKKQITILKKTAIDAASSASDRYVPVPNKVSFRIFNYVLLFIYITYLHI